MKKQILRPLTLLKSLVEKDFNEVERPQDLFFYFCYCFILLIPMYSLAENSILVLKITDWGQIMDDDFPWCKFKVIVAWNGVECGGTQFRRWVEHVSTVENVNFVSLLSVVPGKYFIFRFIDIF